MNFSLLWWAAVLAGAALLVSASVTTVFNGAHLIGVLLCIGPLLARLTSAGEPGGE